MIICKCITCYVNLDIFLHNKSSLLIIEMMLENKQVKKEMLLISTPPKTKGNVFFLPALHPGNQESCLRENSVVQCICET